jgi:hypothetical protein
VDVAIKVENHQSGNMATVEKNKDDEDGWGIGFNLKQITVGTDEDGDDITSCVVVESDGPPSRSQKRLTGHKLRAMDALHDVLIDGKPIHNHHGIPDNTVCAEMDAWRKEFYARTEGTQEAKQKAFKRAVSDLQDLGLVGFRDGLVWAVKKEEQ